MEPKDYFLVGIGIVLIIIASVRNCLKSKNDK